MSEVLKPLIVVASVITLLGGCATGEALGPVSGRKTVQLSLTTKEYRTDRSNTPDFSYVNSDPVNVEVSYKNCIHDPWSDEYVDIIRSALKTKQTVVDNYKNEKTDLTCESTQVSLPKTANMRMEGDVFKIRKLIPFTESSFDKLRDLGTYSNENQPFGQYSRTISYEYIKSNFGDVSSIQDFLDKDFDTYFKRVNEQYISTIQFKDISAD